MATFSWSDTVQIALSSCLPCFTSNSGPSSSTESLVNPNDPTAIHIRRARADELEGLLADVTDTDTEAERMSLHSNPGRGKKRSKKKKASKRITLFGYDLFGKPIPPPIHLPDSDDEEQLGLPAPQPTRSSSLTFDLDAAPLDAATIATISASAPELLQQRAAALEEERRLKEERRERRRERRERRRVAKALTGHVGGEFEGFQGSGDGYPGVPAPMHPTGEEYGPFVRAQPLRGDQDDIDADDADLDGGLYARRNTAGSAGSGSDSRSRTSASRSDQYPRPPPQSQSQPQLKPQLQLQPHQSLGVSSSDAGRKKRKHKKSQPSSSIAPSRSSTSASTSQSPSIPSPISPSFPAYVAEDEFEGAPGGFDGMFSTGGFPAVGLGDRGLPRTGFPSQGFGTGNEERKRRSDSVRAMGGAFLATRGGDVDG